MTGSSISTAVVLDLLLTHVGAVVLVLGVAVLLLGVVLPAVWSRRRARRCAAAAVLDRVLRAVETVATVVARTFPGDTSFGSPDTPPTRA